MKKEFFTVRIGEVDVPVQLIIERRNSVRASLGKRNVIMRFPSHLTAVEAADHRERLINWLREQAAANPDVFARYRTADYQSGDTLRVGERQYTIQLTYEPRKTSSARLKNGRIKLRLNNTLDDRQSSKHIRTLLSRVVGADYLPAITKRVLEFNERYFQRPIKGVSLKYNHSRWGSCSNSGNINLSTRLLFAPQAVVDYVIVHELAHLVEMNHSPRFWAEVARVMPGYEQHEQWLKEFGNKCDF